MSSQTFEACVALEFCVSMPFLELGVPELEDTPKNVIIIKAVAFIKSYYIDIDSD